ncbi:MAG: DUF72 domain-containing protein, partial [Candidatus Bathyarchaeia archaeon]
LLTEKRIALCWSENPYASPWPEVTTDFVYLRFIGDRRKTPEIGWLQHDASEAMERWKTALEDLPSKVKEAYVTLNNRIEGFAPASVNRLRARLGMAELDWSSLIRKSQGETSLLDFT